MHSKVTVVPISGDPAVHDVELEGSSPRVREVLEKAGVKAGREFQIFVGGKPAKLNDEVPDGANVSLTERAAGS